MSRETRGGPEHISSEKLIVSELINLYLFSFTNLMYAHLRYLNIMQNDYCVFAYVL